MSRGKALARNNEQGGRFHPTQKPTDLYEWLLHNYATEGDKILDTHLGSQSSRIAAHKGGFDFVGFEIDPDYFRDGNKRFAQYLSQTRLEFPK
jgi:site-specific DNA-methyltransferase (adenine-specific)